MEKGLEEGKRHALSLSARQTAHIEGVVQVQSFDEQSVLLETDCGEMTVEGEGLHVGTLDIARGVVEVTGRIDGIYYTASAPKRRFGRARLFS